MGSLPTKHLRIDVTRRRAKYEYGKKKIGDQLVEHGRQVFPGMTWESFSDGSAAGGVAKLRLWLEERSRGSQQTKDGRGGTWTRGYPTTYRCKLQFGDWNLMSQGTTPAEALAEVREELAALLSSVVVALKLTRCDCGEALPDVDGPRGDSIVCMGCGQPWGNYDGQWRQS